MLGLSILGFTGVGFRVFRVYEFLFWVWGLRSAGLGLCSPSRNPKPYEAACGRNRGWSAQSQLFKVPKMVFPVSESVSNLPPKRKETYWDAPLILTVLNRDYSKRSY